VQKLRGLTITWLKNGSDLKFRHLSYKTYGVAAEGVWRPVVGVSCWGSCCRLFSEAFSAEFTRICYLARRTAAI
jgi:hypothetical protein